MATEWERNARTYNPEARRRYADAAADRANVFRRDGIQSIGYIDETQIGLVREAISRFKIQSVVAGCCHHYDLDSILALKALKDVALSPPVTRVAAMHIGAEPKILDVSCWKTVAGDGGREAAQRWHRDVDDWRCCKLFVYLSAVTSDNGPFMYVPGSHRHEYFEVRDMPPDDFFCGAGDMPEIADAVASLPHIEMCGRAGHMFMVNNYGYHRGKPVEKGERILFQVLYGLMAVETFTYGTKIPRIREAWGL